MPIVPPSLHICHRCPNVFQGGATADWEPSSVRPVLHDGERAECLQLLLSHGPLEAGQENVHARASGGHQHVPHHPRLNVVRGAFSAGPSTGAGRGAADLGGIAVLFVRVVHHVLHSVYAELYVRVLGGAEGQHVTYCYYLVL